MNDLSRRARRRMRGRRLLVILFVFFVVVLVVRAVFDVWEGWRLNEEIASLGKRYGPLDDWNIGPLQVARAENRARLLAAAASSLTTDVADLDMALNRLRRSPLTGDQAKKIVAENRDAIELAIRAARRPRSNWQIRYESRESANVPPLLDLRQLSQVLALAAREDAAAGRADDAAADLTAGFAEAASLRGEPMTIIGLVGITIATAQVEALRQVLVQGDPSATTLAALASAIDENLVEHPMRPALIAELKLARSIWSRVERGQIEPLVSKPTPVWRVGAAWLFRPVVRSVARQDLAEVASLIDAASSPRNRRAPVVLPLPAGVTRGPWWSPTWRLAIFSNAGYHPTTFRSFIESGDTTTAVVGLSAAAVALRRFRLDRGAYPNTLDELAPAYLKAVPLDPFTDRQLEYARQGAGFELRAHVPAAKRPSTLQAQILAALGEWKVPR